jgi:hypothetical protein
MKRSFQRRSLLLSPLALAVLAGCSSTPQRPTFIDIRFTDRPRLRIYCAAIDVVDDFRPTLQDPHVEHLFPVTPEHALENWAHDRLIASGTDRRLRFRIIDASVRETHLPKKTEGIRGAFTTEQTERYDASVEVAVDLLDSRGFSERQVSAKVARSTTTAEDVTPNQRDQAWYDLTRALMADFDAEMERQLRANLTFYVQ